MSAELLDISDEAKAHIVHICRNATLDENSIYCLSLTSGGTARDKSGKLVERWSTEELSIGSDLKGSVDFDNYAPIQIDSLTVYIHFENLIRLKDKRVELRKVGVGYPNPQDSVFWLLIPVEKNPS